MLFDVIRLYYINNVSCAFKCFWAPANLCFLPSLALHLSSVTHDLDLIYTETFWEEEVDIYATCLYPGNLAAH